MQENSNDAKGDGEGCKKIAVIGSGLAGLTTAYLLSLRTRWEVSIFEKADEVGVDAASIEVKVLKDGKTLGVGIDVPMRSIEAGYYPRLLKLLNDLDIAMRPDDLTFAFSREKARIPYLIYNGLSGRQGFSVPATKSYLAAIVEILYYSLAFIYLYIVSLLHYRLHFFPRINEITFEEFCTDYLIPSKFSKEVLVPLYSGVCTCKESDILKYPAGLIVDYIGAGFGTRHYTIASPRGFNAVVDALTSPIPKHRIHVSTTITRISGGTSKYTLHTSTSTFGPFNHVVLATPAPISATLLPGTKCELRKALSKFKYVPTLVITHTDPSFVPSTLSLQRDLHFQRPSPPISPLRSLEGTTEATHILHHRSPYLQSVKLYQTTNPHRFPQKESILSQTWFERFLPSLESSRVRREVFFREGWGQGNNNIWFVGSWLGEGIPLLEGCVESAENVVDMILSEEKQGKK